MTFATVDCGDDEMLIQDMVMLSVTVDVVGLS